jgi:hypothetical protein
MKHLLKLFHTHGRVIYLNLIDEKRQKRKLTDQNLSDLSEIFYLAQEVGKSLERSKILQR